MEAGYGPATGGGLGVFVGFCRVQGFGFCAWRVYLWGFLNLWDSGFRVYRVQGLFFGSGFIGFGVYRVFRV